MRGRIKRPEPELVRQYNLELLVQQLGLQCYDPGLQLEKKRARTYAWHLRKGNLKRANPELVDKYKLHSLIGELGLAC